MSKLLLTFYRFCVTILLKGINVMDKAKILGITGPSGGGKSTACDFIIKNTPSSAILNVDKFAFKALHDEKQALIKLYGTKIFRDTGKPDMKLLASDKEKLAIVDELTFPRIEDQIKEKLEQHKSKKLVVVDWFQLPHLKEIWAMCDQTVCIRPYKDMVRQIILGTRGSYLIDKDLRNRDGIIDYGKHEYSTEVYNCYSDDFFKEIFVKVLGGNEDVDVRDLKI